MGSRCVDALRAEFGPGILVESLTRTPDPERLAFTPDAPFWPSLDEHPHQMAMHETAAAQTGQRPTQESIPTPKARLIALYLPQYHPIPENDEWWGKGYTEWARVARAKPLFRGHHQPNLPGELGFYDLRVPETRIAQAELAAAHGIEAFCYWHYWFGGRRLLQRPFVEVLRTREPRFPFCLAWANQSWAGTWHGLSGELLVRQTYPGPQDHEAHFFSLLDAFTDDRYVRVDGRPLFVIFRPHELPDTARTLDLWRSLAHRAGLKGLFFVGQSAQGQPHPTDLGFDASFKIEMWMLRRWAKRFQPRARLPFLRRSRLGRPASASYKRSQDVMMREFIDNRETYPCVLPNWDNTPRMGTDGLVLVDPDPRLFGSQIRRAVDRVASYEPSRRLVFVKSWNEWAEGNYLEPDSRYGRGYLEAIREELSRRTPTE